MTRKEWDDLLAEAAAIGPGSVENVKLAMRLTSMYADACAEAERAAELVRLSEAHPAATRRAVGSIGPVTPPRGPDVPAEVIEIARAIRQAVDLK